MKRRLAVLVVATAMAFGSMVGIAAADVDRLTVCHQNRTIQVAAPAIRAHLAHGDSLGPCPD